MMQTGVKELCVLEKTDCVTKSLARTSGSGNIELRNIELQDYTAPGTLTSGSESIEV